VKRVARAILWVAAFLCVVVLLGVGMLLGLIQSWEEALDGGAK